MWPMYRWTCHPAGRSRQSRFRSRWRRGCSRYGSNPMEVINNVKNKIKEIDAGLPQKTLPMAVCPK